MRTTLPGQLYLKLRSSTSSIVLAVVLAAGFGASPAMATYSACGASAAIPTYTGSGTDAGTYGCESTDFIFSGITVSSDSVNDVITAPGINGQGGLIYPMPPLASGVDTYVTPDTETMLASSTLDPRLISFLAPGPDTAAGPTDNYCDQNTRQVAGYQQGWCVNGATQYLVSTITFEISTTSVGTTIYNIGIDGGVRVHSSGGGGTGGATAVVFREFCTQAIAASDNWANNCGGTYGSMQGGVINGKNQDLAYSVSQGIAGGTQQLWIRDTIYMSTDNGEGSWASVTQYDTTLSTIPEPGTLSLLALGAGMLGLVYLRRRSS